MPGVVEDCQGVYDERQRNSGQEKAAAAEKDRGRSTGPVDRRAQRAQELSGRPARSTGIGELGGRSTGLSTDRRVLGKNLLIRF